MEDKQDFIITNGVFMSRNNRFLLGLESDNQIFDEVCGY